MWSYDFIFDSTESGHRLKLMPILDEYTRECPAIRVERSITAENVIDELARLMVTRGAPGFHPIGQRAGVCGQSGRKDAGIS